MENKDIHQIREEENEQILIHLKSILDILGIKCKRCDSITGCLGCSYMEFIYALRNQVKILAKTNPELVEKIFFDGETFDFGDLENRIDKL